MFTMFVSNIILFQETLWYEDAINLWYGKQEMHELQACVLDAHI
jgi:hypothetical protein